MRSASRWLRRAEITLFVLGVSLLGVALGDTVNRRNFEASQDQVLDSRMAAASQNRAAEQEWSAGSAAAAAPGTSGATDSKTSADLPGEPPGELSAERSDGATAAKNPGATSSSNPTELTADADLFGRIEVPRIGLSAIVLGGDDEETLRRAVGWVAGTAPPGTGGNTALAGHRDTHFRPLQEIRVDDRIRLVVPPHTYEYRVDSLRVVRPSEVSVLDSTGTEELTLVTCYPFRFVGPAPDRFIVKATRVQ